MKSKKKILLSIILTFTIVNVFCLINFRVMAADEGQSLLEKMQSQANGFLTKGEEEMGDLNTDIITSEFEGLGRILTMIGVGVMVAVTSFMGIKYITASPEGQAKLKQQLIGVVVSGVVIFGAYFIWSLVINIVRNF